VTAPVWPTVMVTGHRPQHLPRPAQEWVHDQLDRITVKLRDHHGTTTGRSGFARGPDLWWANRLHHNRVLFEAHIPFPQQPKPWMRDFPQDVAEWELLRSLAAREFVYGDLGQVEPADRRRHAVRLLHQRNDGMLTGRALGRQVGPPADAVVAVWRTDKRNGGTYSALLKAHGAGLPVVHVNPAARTVTVPSSARLWMLLRPDRPDTLPLPV
jgi:hypothetical protein